MDITGILNSLSISSFGLNWIDIIIITITIIYAVEGYSLGFFASFIDFLSFVISFVFGLFFYGFVAKLLVHYFSIPQGFANAIGFFAIAVLAEVFFNIILKIATSKVNPFTTLSDKYKHVNTIDSFFGIFPAILSALVIISFILSLIITLPFSVYLKRSVSNSKIGNTLVANTQGFSKSINNIFGGAVNDSLSFLTVEPKSDQSVSLNFRTQNTTVDLEAEQKMWNMVNSQRSQRGLSTLAFSENLAKVGRAHCVDMFNRGYFSHYTPEGASPFDRMGASNITFNYAGENLALAPNTDLAMDGLMQSPGHKANILSPNFKKVGIGVIDGGIYGEMFCQEFTD